MTSRIGFALCVALAAATAPVRAQAPAIADGAPPAPVGTPVVATPQPPDTPVAAWAVATLAEIRKDEGGAARPPSLSPRYDEILKALEPDNSAWSLNFLSSVYDAKTDRLRALARKEDVLRTCGDAVARFSTPGAAHAPAALANAMACQASALHELGRAPEAFVAATATISQFEGALAKVQGLRLPLARAWLYKGNALMAMRQYGEAMSAYDDALRRFGADPDEQIAWRAAMAMRNKRVALLELKRNAEAAALDADFLSRFAARRWPAVDAMTAQVYARRLAAADDGKRGGEAASIAETMRAWAKESASPDARNVASAALVRWAGGLAHAKDVKRAQIEIARVVADFGADGRAVAAVVSAYDLKARIAADEGRREDAVLAWDMAIRHARIHGQDKLADVVAAHGHKADMVQKLGLNTLADLIYEETARSAEGVRIVLAHRAAAHALAMRAVLAPELGRPLDQLPLYDELIRRYGADADPQTRYEASRAMLNKGAILASAMRFEEALNTFAAIETLFGRDDATSLADNLNRARLNKAHALLRLGRRAEAREAFAQFRARLGKKEQLSAQDLARVRQLEREAAAP